jgi:hypothetical protein
MTPAPSTNGQRSLASTDPDQDARQRRALAAIAEAFEEAGLEAALIGAMAVNVWCSPRVSADFDFTVRADRSAIEAALRALAERGYNQVRNQGPDLPSGPDFARLAHRETGDPVDIQTAKTQYQDLVIDRARRVSDDQPFPAATPEDLIVLKLLANRQKDWRDMVELANLPGIDWPYIEKWAATWQVEGRLAELRGRLARDDSGPP